MVMGLKTIIVERIFLILGWKQ